MEDESETQSEVNNKLYKNTNHCLQAEIFLPNTNSDTLFYLQNTDAALLPTISYPAFAVDDDALYSQTLDKIVRKLRGKYGFKRFLRDGYRTANEDKESSLLQTCWNEGGCCRP